MCGEQGTKKEGTERECTVKEKGRPRLHPLVVDEERQAVRPPGHADVCREVVQTVVITVAPALPVAQIVIRDVEMPSRRVLIEIGCLGVGACLRVREKLGEGGVVQPIAAIQYVQELAQLGKSLGHRCVFDS